MHVTAIRNKHLCTNAAIYGIFFLWTALLLPLALCLAFMKPLSPQSLTHAARRHIWRYGRSMLFLLHPWLPVRLRHADMAVRHPGCIIVCNHQSFLDIYLLGAQNL